MTSDLRPQDLESNVRSLSRIVGGGYKGFWNSKDLYVVCKGSKGSKKSKTQALKIVYNMMKPCYELANTLVVRKIGKTIRNTCFTEVRWAIEALGVRELWKVNSSEMKIEYLPTGQVILFAGMDDPLKLASLTVLRGHLCWVWFEEASDFSNYDDVLKLMMSIRGQLPPGYYKQFTFTFNPWSEHHWLKKEFFDKERDDAYVCTTTFRDNEFLGADDIKRYYDLYKNSPRMARIICDGEWGVAEGLIYDNWVEEEFDLGEVMAKHPDAKPSFGLDFGYSISFNAFVAVLVDVKDREMWIYDEYYANGQSNIDLAKAITEMGYAKEEIWADAAEPKSIDEMSKGFDEVTYDENNQPIINHYQLPRIRPALKGADSVQNGIQRMQSFRIHVHPRCINTLIEFNNYAWDVDKDGNFIDKPIKEWDHCLVAGTMVTTDHGEIPIEDIQVGDMVLTHLGYRRVTASGITRPEPAEIWRATLSDGTIIEGTEDHLFHTDEGVVRMRDLKDMYVVKLGARTPEFIQENSVLFHHNPRHALLTMLRSTRAARDFFHYSIWSENRGWVKVLGVEDTGRKEYVYDLTVEEAHTFFANKIYLLNCMDATRYALSKFYIRGKGHVVEVKGLELLEAPSGPAVDKPRKSRRVITVGAK